MAEAQDATGELAPLGSTDDQQNNASGEAGCRQGAGPSCQVLLPPLLCSANVGVFVSLV